ncbi:MAG: hypothetical protein Kow0092_05520 [Deferrisomatales bacterium]
MQRDSNRSWFAWLVAAALALHAAGAAAAPSQCHYCGMRRTEFGHSWVEIRYDGERPLGFCSLHCASIHLVVRSHKVPGQILVGDYRTRKLIDARRAHWVIGGDEPGVMTLRAKWAFEGRTEAEDFIEKHGGRLGCFDEALKAAFEDMYRDILMVEERMDERRKAAQHPGAR